MGTLHGTLFWIFLISGVVALIVWAAGLFRGLAARTAIERSLEALKTRYAKGELSREQFERMKCDLRNGARTASEKRDLENA